MINLVLKEKRENLLCDVNKVWGDQVVKNLKINS